MPAIHIRGGPTAGVKVFRFTSPITKRVTEFQAERGMISVYGETKDHQEDFERVSRHDFRERAKALSRANTRIKKQCHQGVKRWDEVYALQSLIECMIAVIKAAKEQGDPFIPAHMAQAAETFRNRKLILPWSSQPTTSRPVGRQPVLATSSDLPPMPRALPHRPATPVIQPSYSLPSGARRPGTFDATRLLGRTIGRRTV